MTITTTYLNHNFTTRESFNFSYQLIFNRCNTQELDGSCSFDIFDVISSFFKIVYSMQNLFFINNIPPLFLVLFFTREVKVSLERHVKIVYLNSNAYANFR